jgi:hypothetical protein
MDIKPCCTRVLIKELGYSGFLRYIRNFEEGHGEDYLDVIIYVQK